MNTAEQILALLKTGGPQSAQELARQLGMTSMGVRRHLDAAEARGLVAFADRPGKVGRPLRRWLLTEKGHARFPDRHAELAVQLVAQAQVLLGDAALEQLVRAREQVAVDRYRERIDPAAPLAQRVAALAALRDEDGYMAEARQEPDGSILLIENHCPISTAARACLNFCDSELDAFRQILGPACCVERTEHQMAGARRCLYVVRAV
jgi:predicted ArsR family transcriptional regulator